MTDMENLRGSLQGMGFMQLVLAFTAVIGYALAQGRLVSDSARRWAWLLALVSAVSFATMVDPWEHGALLVAFAVVGIGAFAAIVWVVSRVLGVDGGIAQTPALSVPAEFADSSFPAIDKPARAPHRGGVLHTT